MAVHEVYALVKDETIKSVSVYKNYEIANQLARNIFGDTAIAVRCDYYAVSEGDKYIDGTFYYNDGVTPVIRTITGDARCEQNEAECSQLAADLYYVAAMSGIDLE